MPGILLITVAAAAQGTAITVAMDMTAGIIDRFRTMSIARASVLTGHVIASVILALFGLAVVLAVALALGFRPTADPVAWLAVIGLLTLFTFALVWLCAALGLAAKTVETASNTPMVLTLLPFLSSGFVPTETMPPGLRQFAEYQPFTPSPKRYAGCSAVPGPGQTRSPPSRKMRGPPVRVRGDCMSWFRSPGGRT
jgi:ABC-2 type transport system permease protein